MLSIAELLLARPLCTKSLLMADYMLLTPSLLASPPPGYSLSAVVLQCWLRSEMDGVNEPRKTTLIEVLRCQLTVLSC